MMGRYRVAVLFFGLSRNAAACAASINENILLNTYNRDIDFFVASSLNSVDKLRNGRSGEKNIILNKHDIDNINCDINLFRNQNDSHILNEYNIVSALYDYHKNNHITNKVLLHQLYSLKLGYRLLQLEEFGRFSAFLFLRPDLLYLDPLDVSDFVRTQAGRNAVCLPSWHSWGGLNDRFAIASPDAAAAYATRYDLVGSYCQANPLHPERLLAYAMDQAGVSVTFTTARAQRVRATGQIVDEDFTKGGKPRHHASGGDRSAGSPACLPTTPGTDIG